MKYVLYKLQLIILVVLMVGCGSTDDLDPRVSSREVDTEDTYVDMHVTSNSGDKVRVDVQLLQGGPNSTQILLHHDDQLWVSLGPGFSDQYLSDDLFSGLNGFLNVNSKLETNSSAVPEFGTVFLRYLLSGDLIYGGNIDYDQSTSYYITYFRDNRTSASDSSVSLPEEFNITAPLSNEIPSRSNDLIIAWEPYGSNSTVSIYINHSCLNGLDDEVSASELSDTGVYIMTADVLSENVSGQCSSTVEVSKHTLGQIDQALGGGGKIVGHQVRSVNFITTD